MRPALCRVCLSVGMIVSFLLREGADGEVLRVRRLGDPCTTPQQCEEIVADSTCNSGVCECKKGCDRIGDNWCESLADAVKYELPSTKPTMMCNKVKGCDLQSRDCKAMYMRKLQRPRDSLKVRPGSSLYGLCGLNIELTFGKEVLSASSLYTVNFLCYDYESYNASFIVAEIKVKEPPRKLSRAEFSLVSCTVGPEECYGYRFSGFVVAFHVGVPNHCFEKSSSDSVFARRDWRWTWLLALAVTLRRQTLA